MANPREEQPRIGRLIDESKLDPFLMLALTEPRMLRVAGKTLPSSLSFEWCQPAMQEMMEQTKKVDTATREEVVELAVQLHGEVPDLPQDVLEDLFIADSSGQGDAERIRTIYADPKNQRIDCTRIQHGEYRTVDSQILDVCKRGYVPLLEIHTHPREAFFSGQDYMPLLIRIGDKSSQDPIQRQRLVNANMVLTPAAQTFSIATSETPLLSVVEAKALIDAEKQATTDEYRQRADAAGIDHNIIDQGAFTAIRGNTQGFVNFIRSTRSQVESGQLSPYARRMQFNQFLTSYSEECRIAAEMSMRDETLSQQVLNSHLINFARNIHVALYMGTNMKDFRAFSA